MPQQVADDIHAEGVMRYTRYASDDMLQQVADDIHAEGVMRYTRCASDDMPQQVADEKRGYTERSTTL